MFTYRISNVGRIKAIGVGVYWDQAATNPVSSIDWGTRAPGDLVGVTVYIKNVKNTNCTLSMNSSAYNPPAAASYLTLSWNATGQLLRPGQVLRAQFQLLVSSTITGVDTFSFDIWITATEKGA